MRPNWQSLLMKAGPVKMWELKESGVFSEFNENSGLWIQLMYITVKISVCVGQWLILNSCFLDSQLNLFELAWLCESLVMSTTVYSQNCCHAADKVWLYCQHFNVILDVVFVLAAVCMNLAELAIQQQQQQQPFYGRLSGTTRVSRYQKKHSPTHHPHHHPIFISFQFPSTHIISPR